AGASPLLNTSLSAAKARSRPSTGRLTSPLLSGNGKRTWLVGSCHTTDSPYMHAVIETAVFLRDAARAGISETERDEIIAMIARDPTVGDVIPGTAGAPQPPLPRPPNGTPA